MEPTSAIGKRARRAGFTLTEILVVLLILGLLGGAVLVAAPDLRPSLADEAERFGARLVRAKEEAVLTNRTIEVRITPQGYAFGISRGGERKPLEEKPFGPVEWAVDTTATLSGADERARIAFDSTGFATPAEVNLFRANGRMRVAVDAAGNVRIDAPGR